MPHLQGKSANRALARHARARISKKAERPCVCPTLAAPAHLDIEPLFRLQCLSVHNRRKLGRPTFRGGSVWNRRRLWFALPVHAIPIDRFKLPAVPVAVAVSSCFSAPGVARDA